MEKRSVARELAFIGQAQLPKQTEKINELDLQAICISAIRTLADHSKDNLKEAESFFIRTERLLMEHRINHPENEGLNQASRNVELPETDEFLGHLDNCYQAISLVNESLRIPEIFWHYRDKEVEEFVIELLMTYLQHKNEIKDCIKRNSKKWQSERLRKLDKSILELAATEILFMDTPNKVVASEAVKIAKKYLTEEGLKFINGIIADIIKEAEDG
jgi:transcription antitermination protein NusB